MRPVLFFFAFKHFEQYALLSRVALAWPTLKSDSPSTTQHELVNEASPAHPSFSAAPLFIKILHCRVDAHTPCLADKSPSSVSTIGRPGSAGTRCCAHQRTPFSRARSTRHLRTRCWSLARRGWAAAACRPRGLPATPTAVARSADFLLEGMADSLAWWMFYCHFDYEQRVWQPRHAAGKGGRSFADSGGNPMTCRGWAAAACARLACYTTGCVSFKNAPVWSQNSQLRCKAWFCETNYCPNNKRQRRTHSREARYCHVGARALCSSRRSVV